MRQRSLPKIFALNILTLGLYEIYWLSQTRKEMIVLTGSHIPGVTRFALLRAISLAVLLLSVWNLHVAITPRPVTGKPPAACYGRYDTDPSCREEIDGYYAGDHQAGSLMIFLACLVVLALLYWFSLKWLVPYCEAVERVLGGRSMTDTAMFFFFMYSPGIGMLLIQDRFNRWHPVVPA